MQYFTIFLYPLKKTVQVPVANQLELNYKSWSSIKFLEKERPFLLEAVLTPGISELP